MTFEERIEKLTERHEVLAQTVELIGHDIRALAAANAVNTQNIAKLIELSNQDAENIRRLASIVESHEGRDQ